MLVFNQPDDLLKNALISFSALFNLLFTPLIDFRSLFVIFLLHCQLIKGVVVMFIVANRVPVASGWEETFEERFRQRAGQIDKQPGFAHDLGQGRSPCRDDRTAAGHR